MYGNQMLVIGEKIGGEEVEDKNREDVKNKESVHKDRRDILIRTGCIMLAFAVVSQYFYCIFLLQLII